jgi:hypothetical protein
MLLHRSDASKVKWKCVEALMLWGWFCVTFGGKSDEGKTVTLDPSTALRMTEADLDYYSAA